MGRFPDWFNFPDWVDFQIGPFPPIGPNSRLGLIVSFFPDWLSFQIAFSSARLHRIPDWNLGMLFSDFYARQIGHISRLVQSCQIGSFSRLTYWYLFVAVGTSCGANFWVNCSGDHKSAGGRGLWMLGAFWGLGPVRIYDPGLRFAAPPPVRRPNKPVRIT